MRGWTKWMLAVAVAGVAACGTPVNDSGITKEDAEKTDGTSDEGEDLCASFGWYDDGVCDNFCPEPDPDCKSGQNGSTNNGSTNNASTNNGSTNNTSTNNGSTNNTSTNNGSNNNAAACTNDIDCESNERCVNGACEPAQAGDVCGGLAGLTCADGQFCKIALADECGIADQTGVCEVTPDACPDIYMPVCGCDGNTYGNECEAHAVGVSVGAQGTCDNTCQVDGDCLQGQACVNGMCQEGQDTNQCGGFAGTTCEIDEWCNYPDDSMCGAADQLGTCETRPQACTLQYDPVCGCDGNTYSNECFANLSGVDIISTGECPTTCNRDQDCGQDEECLVGVCVPTGGSACGGIAGLTCRGNEWCDYDADCGQADMFGTCKARPDACATIYDPVCGCDGNTYSNACFAHAAGVDVHYAGMCN